MVRRGPNRFAADPISRLWAWYSKPRSRAEECIWVFVLAFFGTLCLRAFVVEARWIPSSSMLPTLAQGDRLLVDKLGVRFSQPRRGSIVVFAPPKRAWRYHIRHALIKRVVAGPGDHIHFENGLVHVNGIPLVESYLAKKPHYEQPDWQALGMPGGRVPAANIFVMGDNRDNSTDSRVFGPVPLDHLIGRPLLRVWPLQRLALL